MQEPIPCFVTLEGHRVRALCFIQDGSMTSCYHIQVQRSELPPELVSQWDKGTSGRFTQIEAYLAKSQVEFEDS